MQIEMKNEMLIPIFIIHCLDGRKEKINKNRGGGEQGEKREKTVFFSIYRSYTSNF